MSGPGADREARDETTAALFALTRDLATAEVAPKAVAGERESSFPRDIFRTLGGAGLLGLPYPEEFGGGGQPYETYLQVVEELATAWLAVGLGVSVHTLTCFPLATAGSEEQQQRWLPDLLGGDLLGAYCLSEPGSGSDAAALRTRAVADGDEFVIDGVKAWISHGGQADFYTLFARTSGEHDGPDRAAGISCLHVPAGTAGVHAGPPEHKMGMRSSVTAQMIFEGARVPAANLVGERDRGFRIALAALDSGRLGIAACGVGVAQAALDLAVGYARQRRQFGQPIAGFQGLSVHARGHGDGGGGGPRAVPGRRPAQGRGQAVRPAGGDGQAAGDRHGDAGDDGRGPGPRGLRLRRGLSGRAAHAGGQGAADRRGHQPGPANGDRPGTSPAALIAAGALGAELSP